ncbi:prepilin peptidase [Amycolatopsis marina]|uniref:prepilin peptidase n=1 Tax=Amycolatopsis marina TaxID=490629 RepID=UPI001FE93C1C|nr:A24 family peptidase [Amycolatopsis marina]
MNWTTAVTDLTAVVAVLGLAAAGGGAGRLARWALVRSSSPAPLRAGPCEAGTALCWLLLAWLWQTGILPGWWLPVPLALTALGIPLVYADLRYRRLPDVLTLSAYPILAFGLTVAAATGTRPGLLWRALVVAVLFGGAHAVVHALAPTALGAGDVKLAGSLGGVLGASGWAAALVAAFLAAVVTSMFAGVAALAGHRRWRSGIPHGPGLLLAVTLVAVAGVRYGGGPDG